MEKSKLLDRCGALGEDRLLLAKVLDRAEQAERRSIPAATDFLSPAQRVQAEDLLRLAGISETAFASLGGYPEAERRILLFLPDWLDPGGRWQPKSPAVPAGGIPAGGGPYPPGFAGQPYGPGNRSGKSGRHSGEPGQCGFDCIGHGGGLPAAKLDQRRADPSDRDGH